MAPGDRVFGPAERFTYRVLRIDPDVEQRWSSYVASALVTTLAEALLTYLVLRTQRLLPGNLDHVGDLSPGCRSTPRSAS